MVTAVVRPEPPPVNAATTVLSGPAATAVEGWSAWSTAWAARVLASGPSVPSGEVGTEIGWVRVPREPYEHVFADPDRQGGECVLGVFGLEAGQWCGSGLGEHGADLVVEEVHERLIERAVAVVERGQDE